MPARRATCPYCGNEVALTKKGKLHAHRDPSTKNPCLRRDPA